MVRRFSRSNDIGRLPAVLVNRILNLAWIGEAQDWIRRVLALFGLNRLRLTYTPDYSAYDGLHVPYAAPEPIRVNMSDREAVRRLYT